MSPQDIIDPHAVKILPIHTNTSPIPATNANNKGFLKIK